MAHRPNGDPVQQHSAGPNYPYVIYRQDSHFKPFWGILGPKPCNKLFTRYDDAEQVIRIFQRNGN